ncbi:MAG: anhydro-N-acetylmuramic acid kinase [Saprospiraceae bacterium]|nr:anhydro-N-acetylmuramic acid kinase [Saprospiraceae bacterium]
MFVQWAWWVRFASKQVEPTKPIEQFKRPKLIQQTKSTYHVLGLMSGSSLDGLDIAFCQMTTAWEAEVFVVKNWELLKADTLPFNNEWQQRLRTLPSATAFEFCEANAAFGHYLGQLVNLFFEEKKMVPSEVDLIASHGHTIFHEPKRGFTTQIGDGAALATTTGCQVVSDFRTADVALGGQGAPLAPMADKLLFPGFDFHLNIGGIANITYHAPDHKIIAFDVCGANQALNALANLLGQDYDRDGQLAATGNLDTDLLAEINGPDYFSQPHPKSLSNQWVQQYLTQTCLRASSPIADRLHTVCQHIAQQLEQSIAQLLKTEGSQKEKYSLLATGGGAFNSYLMQCIQARLPMVKVVVPEENVVKFKEALLMALLGVMQKEGTPNCIASVTGAKRDAFGGACFRP